MVDGIYISATEVRISKPGADTGSTNLDDFIVHESFSALELVIGGLRTVYTGPTTLAHGLGYVPTVILGGNFTGSAGNALKATATADSSNVYIYSEPPGTYPGGVTVMILGAPGA